MPLNISWSAQPLPEPSQEAQVLLSCLINSQEVLYFIWWKIPFVGREKKHCSVGNKMQNIFLTSVWGKPDLREWPGESVGCSSPALPCCSVLWRPKGVGDGGTLSWDGVPWNCKGCEWIYGNIGSKVLKVWFIRRSEKEPHTQTQTHKHSQRSWFRLSAGRSCAQFNVWRMYPLVMK